AVAEDVLPADRLQPDEREHRGAGQHHTGCPPEAHHASPLLWTTPKAHSRPRRAAGEVVIPEREARAKFNCFSPGGAAVVKPGRKPLERKAGKTNGGAPEVRHESVAPPGLPSLNDSAYPPGACAPG